MGHQLAFTEQNADRILAVQGLFGASGKPLAKPGRILVGEGHLLKLCRRSPQLKVFLLFDDILVYGSVVIPGRWYAHQQVVPLEDVSLEDMEDGVEMRNQWLIRTPRKSFYVSASSADEKRAWMRHIGECRAERLRRTGRPAGTRFAAVWVPDRASAVCMRCPARFGVALRRHHCRRCGFVVCAGCSRERRVMPDISPKPVRVCRVCRAETPLAPAADPPELGPAPAPAPARGRGDSDGKTSSEGDEASSGEDECEHGYEEFICAPWESQNHERNSSWSTYVDLSEHFQNSKIGDF